MAKKDKGKKKTAAAGASVEVPVEETPVNPVNQGAGAGWDDWHQTDSVIGQDEFSPSNEGWPPMPEEHHAEHPNAEGEQQTTWRTSRQWGALDHEDWNHPGMSAPGLSPTKPPTRLPSIASGHTGGRIAEALVRAHRDAMSVSMGASRDPTVAAPSPRIDPHMLSNGGAPVSWATHGDPSPRASTGSASAYRTNHARMAAPLLSTIHSEDALPPFAGRASHVRASSIPAGFHLPTPNHRSAHTPGSFTARFHPPGSPSFPQSHFEEMQAGTEQDRLYPTDRNSSRTLSHGEEILLDNADGLQFSEMQFQESNQEALRTAEKALFGSHRPANERLFWTLPPEHDDVVMGTLQWIDDMCYYLATLALNKFIETSSRGALVTNATYRNIGAEQEPVFDWMTFDQARGTMDETFQAAIATYDPRKLAIVYVILVSKSGNSVGVWRRKLQVPPEICGAYRGELDYTIDLLSERPHVCAVEMLPKNKHHSAPATMRGPRTNSFIPHSILRNPTQFSSGFPPPAGSPPLGFASMMPTTSVMNTAATPSHTAHSKHVKHASAPATVPTKNVLIKEARRKEKREKDRDRDREKDKDKGDKKPSWVGRLFGGK